MIKFAGLLLLIFSLESCVTGKIEEPKFKIVLAENDFEIRDYEPRIVAETVVRGEFSEVANAGFRRLADYIFGNNTKREEIAMTAPVSQEPRSEKIAMTAPVAQEKGADGNWVITFTMPSSYSMESLPKPNSELVVLRRLPSSKFAVVKFSGFNRQSTVLEKTAALEKWLSSKAFKSSGKEPLYARYNPPWTPWFLRRNEVLIELQ